MPAVAIPSLETCPERLSSAHEGAFRRDGFLAFDDFLPAQEVHELNDALKEVIRALHADALAGTAKVERSRNGMRNYSGMRIEKDGGEEKQGYGLLLEPDVQFDLATASFSDLDNSYRKVSHPCRAHPAFARLSQNPKLLAILEALLGPKPILYGDMALCKPARIGVAKPWHQDSAYFMYEPYDAGVDIWIALDDATIENGCMYVLPGAHRVGPKKHVHLDDCTVAEGRLDLSQGMPVEMRAGGILFFSVMLPHYTPPNRSDKRRRAVQLFYRGANTKLIGREEKIKTFVEADGTAASCAAAGSNGSA